MKEFSKFQVATLKRVAQSVSPLVRIKERLTKEIQEREKELESTQIQIDAFQGPIKEMTGGFSTEDLVQRVVEVTDKLDKDGKPVKVTKWVLKYPETVIPVIEEEQEPEPKLEPEPEPVVTVENLEVSATTSEVRTVQPLNDFEVPQPNSELPFN